MTTLRLILRNLLYFRAAGLAVVAGMAVATAVLAGALMVGDSVRGSLRALAVERLGPVDYVLAGGRFFDDSLAARVAADPALGGRYQLGAMVNVTGGASVGEGAAKRRTAGVQIMAAGEGWVGVAPETNVGRGACVVNGEMAAASVLDLKPGPTRVIFTFPSMDDTPRESAVARRGLDDTTATLPASTVQAIAGGRGFLSLFSLTGGQRTPLNAWVNLSDLQDAVAQPGRANVLLAHATSGESAARMAPANATAAGARGAAELNEALKREVDLSDYGLDLTPAGSGDEAMLTARGTYLSPPVVAAADAAGRTLGLTPRSVTVNLVNAIVKLSAGGAAAAPATAESAADTKPSGGPAATASALHYVIGAGISTLDDRPLAPDEIALNHVTADQLGAAVGDRVRLDYFKRGAAGELSEVRSSDLGYTFKVARILPMTGLGADASLTPQYKGLTDAPTVSSWDPPKELGITGDKLKLAERDNDAYWKQYKAAPRLFINLDTARKLWGGPYGDVTSVRVPQARATEFRQKVRDAIDPASMGLAFRPLKAEQLAAASGGTDFSELFVYFSFFLIAAAVLLVAMLFRLAIEQRARQLGLLAAVGFTPRRLRSLALCEGMTLAIIGAAIGLAAAVGYTWVIVYGLRTWWVGAVGTTALRLYVEPRTLLTGFFAGLAVAFCAVLWGVWRVGRVDPSRLLAGAWGTGSIGKRRTGRLSRLIGIVLVGLGLAVLAAVAARVIANAETALAAGALLLCGGLFWLGGWLRPRRHTAGASGIAGMSSVTAMGVRNASRHTARSVLSIGLIAFAAFTLITVASMRRNDPDDTGDPRSGAGGYRLVMQSAVPILADLNTAAGREQAGVREPDAPVWQQARFVQLRRWAGQDISCLNLTRPTSPTILGVPHSIVEGGRFTFAASTAKVDNPWTLLEGPAASGSAEDIPVITDAETAEFILHLSLGGSIAITDGTGKTRNLHLVATLSHSIFQSEMLMSEANFRRLFPAQAGFGTILVETPADQVTAVRQVLNSELDPYAVTVETTAARLAAYKEIVNTYLSTFLALGSLGLALGSIGLAVVLVRNVIERRPELALLAALGFRPGDRVWLVLAENAFLLVLGLFVGAACAVLGVLPTVLGGANGIAWGPLALTLIGVLLLGVLSSAAAVWASGVRTTPADLRSE